MTVLQTIAVAFGMFSALPMPQFEWNEKNMRYAMCAFPLIGLVCGGLWCLCGVLPLPELARAALGNPKADVRTVHRLDQVVSGLMVLARSAPAASELARQIRENAGKTGCNSRARKWFYLMRFAHKHLPPSEPDYGYWEKKGWHKSCRPWN